MNPRLAGDVVRPVLLVAVATLLIVAIAGAWPPLVAVETGSMEPTVERGDLVVVTATDRFPWGGVSAGDEPVRAAPADGGGDVIVFSVPDDDGPPILHRVAFAVEAGEDWTRRGDDGLIGGDCRELRHCPAPHDGYVTRGDANDEYDQSAGIAPVVRPEWIHSKALVSLPSLGWPRLGFDLAVSRVGVAPVLLVVGGGTALLGGVGFVLLGRLRNDLRRDA
ncbi:S26 family signal peptidase [Halorubrum sp. DTA98]|uniref:S26 family signal peptidase n=1 Tax=Halorubrum sp. DTA98 TaxID=3402163 RepID=UPI003AAF3AC0